MTESSLPMPPARPPDAHKGTFGRVLVVAGSEGMAGAASLAGRGALHGGAGLVTVAVPRCIASIVATAHPSYMTLPLPDSDGHLAEDAIEFLEPAVEGKSAVGVGPGLGVSHAATTLVHKVWEKCKAPLVLDADGLNAFAGCCDRLANAPAPRVCTPHLGEFARLAGVEVSAVAENREQLGRDFARTHGIVLLLKGSGTMITDGEQFVINSTGNSGMATGGTGDVLTGLISSLLAQGMDAFEAAHLGAHLHGLAGDLAAAEVSQQYLTSDDLVDWLSPAWKHICAADA